MVSSSSVGICQRWVHPPAPNSNRYAITPSYVRWEGGDAMGAHHDPPSSVQCSSAPRSDASAVTVARGSTGPVGPEGAVVCSGARTERRISSEVDIESQTWWVSSRG